MTLKEAINVLDDMFRKQNTNLKAVSAWWQVKTALKESVREEELEKPTDWEKHVVDVFSHIFD